MNKRLSPNKHEAPATDDCFLHALLPHVFALGPASHLTLEAAPGRKPRESRLRAGRGGLRSDGRNRDKARPWPRFLPRSRPERPARSRPPGGAGRDHLPRSGNQRGPRGGRPGRSPAGRESDREDTRPAAGKVRVHGGGGRFGGGREILVEGPSRGNGPGSDRLPQVAGGQAVRIMPHRRDGIRLARRPGRCGRRA